MKRKGYLIFVIPVVLCLIGVTVVLFFKNDIPWLRPQTLSIEEAESLVDQCQIKSVGRSHYDLSKGLFTIGKNPPPNGDDYKLDIEDWGRLMKKVDEVEKSGKCPPVAGWVE